MKKDTDICDLCGLRLDSGIQTLERKGTQYRFCCIGCRQVFRMLADATESPDISSFKETEIFKQCQAMGIIPGPEAGTPGETPPLAANETDNVGELEKGHALKLRYTVEGMWCPACAWVIENTLLKQKGVLKAACHFSTDRLEIIYDPVKTTPQQFSGIVGQLGYSMAEPGETTQSRENTKEIIRFAVSAFLTMNVMMLSFSLYSGFFSELSSESIRYLSWPIWLMATGVVFYGGRKIHQKGWAAWQSLGFGMETLISTGALSSYFFSLYHFFMGSIHLYFDTSSMLITLVLLGKLLERRTRDKINKDLESFFSLVPAKVRIPTPAFPDGRYVSLKQLGEGDLFILEENEIAPADGLIIKGQGAMDESSLTGEANPKNKKAGDRIVSGTRLFGGKMVVRADRVGEKSTLGQMIQVMEKALGQKTALEGKTDLILRWFVPAVLFLALATVLGWWIWGLSFEDSLVRGVTVMVISCPCALGIAIPLARVAGISLAARKGILVRDFSALESSQKIDTFVFDKTGTLTTGKWHVLSVESLSPDWTAEKILAAASALEKNCEHPIGRIICQYGRQNKILPARISSVEIHENGISGIFESREIKIGAASFFSLNLEKRPNMDGEKPVHSNDPPDDQDLSSTVFLTVDSKVVGKIEFGDRIKKGAVETIQHLGKQHYDTWVISGDSTKVVGKLGRKLGVSNAFGDMLPWQKADFIQQLREKGKKVAMVGDGINDALALARSHLAIAVHSESPLGKEAAHLTLMRGEPFQVIEFLNMARKVNGKISQNLIFSLIYNVISIPVAMAGLLSPLIAVSAMMLSSLSVTGNTLLLIRKNRRV